MSNDERPDSLAAQAAAWVPPWERPRAELDRAYQAAHRATDDPEETASDDAAAEDDDASIEPAEAAGSSVDAGGVSQPAADAGGAAVVEADTVDARAGDASVVDADLVDARAADAGDASVVEADPVGARAGGASVVGADPVGGRAAGSSGASVDGADPVGGRAAGSSGASVVEAAVEASVRAGQVAAVEERADELGAEAERAVARERAQELADLDDRGGPGARPDDDEERSDAGLSDDDDDFDPAFEGGNPPGYHVTEPAESEPGSAGSGRGSADLDGSGTTASELDASRGGSGLDRSRAAASESGDAPATASGIAGARAATSKVDSVRASASEFAGRRADGSGIEDVRAGASGIAEPRADGSGVDGAGAVTSEIDEARAAGSVVDEGRAVVDAPREVAGEGGAEPTDVRLGGDVPLPEAVEEAVEAGEDEGGAPVDDPLPVDGDDAGDVFDLAADDDVSDDGEVDLPFAEVVPTDDADEDAALEADDAEFGAGPEFGAPAGGGGDERGGVDGHDAEGGLGDSAGAYAAGAADAGAALRGRHSAGADGGEAGAAGSGGVGRGEAGSAVPVQGRRRRGDAAASGRVVPRTSEAGEAESESAADAVSDAVPALEDDAELAAALEAIMLVVDEPVGEMQLAQILEQPTERIAAMLDDLSARYTAAGRGFDLRRAAGGWRLYTRPEYAAYVERFVLDGQSVRLTQAALETLAVVAYKQPVTRSRISAIRGVNCDGVMRTLVTRSLIEECGTEGETGAHLYRTTALFLEKLGLNSVDQLPPLAPFLPDDVEEVLDASG